MDDLLSKLVEIEANQKDFGKALESQTTTLEKHNEILQEQKEILIKNTMILDEHQRRATSHEEEMKFIRLQIQPLRDDMIARKGASSQVSRIGVILTAAFSAFGIIEIIKHLLLSK